MKLLIVGLNYAPEPVGIGPYTAGLAEAMARRGHTVEVIAGKPYYPQWRPYEGQPPGVTRSHENGVAVTRVPHYIPANPSGARRIAHHASFAARALVPALAAAKGADLVFAVAPSLLSVPVALRAATRTGAPLWLHIQDFEVEAALATGLLEPDGMAARAARNLERRLFARAARVSTISPQMCAKLADKGVPQDRIYQLRNWASGDFGFADANPRTYRERWGLADRTVALYSGNIANKQGIEIIVEAARKLSARRDIAFVICGEGPNRTRLATLAQGLDNVHLHDLQPAGDMGDLLAMADIHLLPQIAGAADLVLPSKLTNMLASGRPVVATALPGTGLYDEVDGCGVLTPPGDGDALAAAVAALAADADRRNALGTAARQRAMERWQQDAIIDRFAAEASALAGREGGVGA